MKDKIEEVQGKLISRVRVDELYLTKWLALAGCIIGVVGVAILDR